MGEVAHSDLGFTILPSPTSPPPSPPNPAISPTPTTSSGRKTTTGTSLPKATTSTRYTICSFRSPSTHNHRKASKPSNNPSREIVVLELFCGLCEVESKNSFADKKLPLKR